MDRMKDDISSFYGFIQENDNDEVDMEAEPDKPSESTEQERETYEDAEGDIQAQCETQTEDTCASTSTGPSDSPCLTSRSERNVFTSRRLLLLSLALSVCLLAGLVAVASLYSNALHKDLSATLNTTETSGCRVCPAGWAHNSGKCYLFSSTRKTWFQSRDHCITLGGHLAIVNNQEEQTFLSQSAIEDITWMGLNDQETEGQWIWMDSTTLNETGAEFWRKRSDGHPDEPDDWSGDNPLGEDCAFLRSGAWGDNSCNNSWTFVCETMASERIGFR